MKRLIPTFLAAVALALIWAPTAPAAFGLQKFDVSFLGPDGSSTAQAGSHPYALRSFFEVETEDVGVEELPGEAIKDIFLAQVEGFVGDQSAVPRCPTADFLVRVSMFVPSCSDSSAIGYINLTIGQAGSGSENKGVTKSPVYNLVPSPGKVAKLGFLVQTVPVTIDIALSQSPPYKLVAEATNVSQVLEVFGGEVVLWGVPADPRHDKERGNCFNGLSSCPAGVSEAPFLTLPRACNGPLLTEYELDSWLHPDVWVSGAVATHDDAVPPNPQGMIGCGKLGFGPATDAQPSSISAETAAGIDFTVDVSDEGLKNSEGTANADIEAIEVAFPPGVTANPGAAEGLGVCSAEQFEAEELEAPPGVGCPEASKLGSVEAETPLLENHPLHGSVYLAAPDDPESAGQENPFDSLIALYLVVEDPELGIFITQAGEVEPNLKTGQIITRFEELPPFPLAHVDVHLRSGPRAPLITPPTCGHYTTKALLTPSSGAAPLPSSSSFEITSGPGGGPCPTSGTPPFAPGFEAGSQNNAAGAYSPFSMHIVRQDGEADLTRFSAVLPSGVTGKIAGVAKCSDAAIAAAKGKTGKAELASPSCPASSQLGHVLGGAGVGTALTYVPGSLYLAGPFNGDPLSVVAIVPAVAGPFDAGTVVTRVALTLNPVTAEVEVDGAASDPIPHILKGIPLKVRELRVSTDRPNFTLNPTSCAEKQTRATIGGGGADPFTSADDTLAAAISRYQAASCASLAFKPKLTLSMTGGTKRNDHPALSSVLTYPPGPGYANIAKAVVTLPHSEFIDPEHLGNPCTRVQFKANACPPETVLGTARATTPLLDEPLEGPVYFRSNGGERKVPDVVAVLHGLFDLELVGYVDSKNARIRTTFATPPDAPVTKFTLKLKGGKEGLLVNSANLCAQKRKVGIVLTAQNGRRQESEPALQVKGCKGKSAAKHKRRR